MLTKSELRKCRKLAAHLHRAGEEVAYAHCGRVVPAGLELRSEKGIRVDFIDDGPYPREGYESVGSPTIRYEYSDEYYHLSFDDLFREVPGSWVFVEAGIGPYARKEVIQ